MKKSILSIVFLLSFGFGFSQSKKFANDIKETLYIHDTTSTVTSEVVALNAFKELAEKYPNEWLPNYWASYLCTQIARLFGRPGFPEDLSPEQLLRDASAHLEKSASIKGEMNPSEKSDFLMLEGFIYSFVVFALESEEEREKYQNLNEEKYKEAMMSNPRNPLMYVLKGINLLGSEDYQDLVAGIALLDYAEQTFEKESNRGLTTYWNKDFIKFWRSRGEEKLKGLLEG